VITVLSEQFIEFTPTDYSFNSLEGAGRMDGEGIEWVHSMSGPLCASTKQMGLGYHHDNVDAHWLFWNWQKIIRMGKSHFGIMKLFTCWCTLNRAFVAQETLQCTHWGPQPSRALWPFLWFAAERCSGLGEDGQGLGEWSWPAESIYGYKIWCDSLNFGNLYKHLFDYL
jgi:hypothetical protein